jgi:hypothetical protein
MEGLSLIGLLKDVEKPLVHQEKTSDLTSRFKGEIMPFKQSWGWSSTMVSPLEDTEKTSSQLISNIWASLPEFKVTKLSQWSISIQPSYPRSADRAKTVMQEALWTTISQNRKNEVYIDWEGDGALISVAIQ